MADGDQHDKANLTHQKDKEPKVDAIQCTPVYLVPLEKEMLVPIHPFERLEALEQGIMCFLDSLICNDASQWISLLQEVKRHTVACFSILLPETHASSCGYYKLPLECVVVNDMQDRFIIVLDDECHRCIAV